MTRRPSRKSRPSARKPSASTGMSTGVERPQIETNTEYTVQGNYGGGWETVTTETSSSEASKRLREYRENEPQYSHRIIATPTNAGRTVTPEERKRDPYASADSRVYPEENRTPARTYNLDPQYDSRKSFYGKAKVTDSNGRRTLTSYQTDVAYIQDGKAFVNGTYSSTTLRHIKEFLKQNGFKAESKSQIESDYKR